MEKHKSPIALIKDSISTLKNKPTVFLPFLIIIFIEILFLEFLYFLPRNPLVNFFGPFIKIWGEIYLHYPANFIFIDSAFNYIQIFLFITINCLLISTAMQAIGDKTGNLKKSLIKALNRYVHIFVAALVFFALFYFIYKIYGLAVARAVKIRSTEGFFYFLKWMLIGGTQYFNLLIGISVTSLLAFLLPEINLNNTNIFRAIFNNFRIMGINGLFFCVALVFLPTVFYIPMIIVKTYLNTIINGTWPGISFIITIFSVILMGIIDAVVYTALTKYYLLRK